jgi:hypothetical protein
VAADVRRLTNVSESQYQAIPPARVASSEIWYVYAAATLLIGWAALVLAVWISVDDFGPPFRRAMIPVALELAVGAGLLLRRRWGWILGIVTSILLIAEGLRRVIVVSDREWVLFATWMLHYFLPRLVLLVVLLPSRARRAFLGE